MGTPLYVDGVEYHKITDVAEMVGVHANTLRLWDNCSVIPNAYKYGQKGIRYWNNDDIKKIKAYKETQKYGQLANVTRQNRGSNYKRLHDNLPRNKSIAYYHNVFDFNKFFTSQGFLNVKAVIDPHVKSAVIIADGKAISVPFELLEKEDREGIKQHLTSKLPK